MSEPFIGEIRMVGFTYAPEGWADCDGRLLQIAQYQALYALLGTTYGGDGRTTFGLPDLRGRVPINVGQGPGLTPRTQGQMGGQETVPLQQVTVATSGRDTATVYVGTGASQPDMQPFLCVRFIIALEGYFPPRP